MGGRVKPIDIFPHFLVVQGDVACNQEPRPTKLPDCKGMQGLINSVYLLAHGHDEGDVQTSFVRVKEDETAVVGCLRLDCLRTYQSLLHQTVDGWEHGRQRVKMSNKWLRAIWIFISLFSSGR